MTPGPALPQTALGRGPSSPPPPVQQPPSLQALGAPRCSRAPLPSLTEPPPQGTAPGTEQGCKRRPQDGAGTRSPAASAPAPRGCPKPAYPRGAQPTPPPRAGVLTGRSSCSPFAAGTRGGRSAQSPGGLHSQDPLPLPPGCLRSAAASLQRAPRSPPASPGPRLALPAAGDARWEGTDASGDTLGTA